MSSRTQSGQRILEQIARTEFGARGVEWRQGGKHLIALVLLPAGTARVVISKNCSGDTRNLGNFVRQHIRRAQAQAA